MSERIRKFIDKYKGARGITDATCVAPDFEKKVGEFKEYYSANFTRLRAAEKTFRNLVQLLLSDVEIEEPKMDSRVKDRNECIRKFELKYRDDLERSAQEYSIQNHISDLIGVRVICLYETDIPVVEAVLRKNFEVKSTTNKTKSLTEIVNSFGYKGLHLDLQLSKERREFPEYSNFGDLQFEIQIRSIVQDAWSEVDHKLKYKRQIPDALKRRILRLAAIFELADQEFVAVRDETERLEATAANAATIAAQLSEEDQVHSLPEELDSFSFLSIMKARHPYYTFDPIRIDGFVDEVKQMDSDLTVAELRSALDRFTGLVSRYRAEKIARNIKMNPFTEIRHILYLHKPTIFDRMLYPIQRDTFLDWLNNRSEDEIPGGDPVAIAHS